jgi:transposase InsO family protein
MVRELTACPYENLQAKQKAANLTPLNWSTRIARKTEDQIGETSGTGQKKLSRGSGRLKVWSGKRQPGDYRRGREELPNREVFFTLKEAQTLIEPWRQHYNTKRPHSALGYLLSAPETITQMDQRPITHQHSNWTS